MNWLDFLVLVSLFLFGLEGFKKSFIGECLNFLSFLLALFLSLRFYNLSGELISGAVSYSALFLGKTWQLPHSLANVLGFVIFWLLVETLFFALIRLGLKPNNFTFKADKLFRHLSVIPAFLRGLVFIAVILVVVGTFPIQPQVKQALFDSRIGSLMMQKTIQLEQPLKNVFGGITNESLSFLTVKPQSGESVDLGFKTDKFRARDDLEAKMIEMVNKERTKLGLNILKFDPKLRSPARIHSEDMLKRGYFSHHSPEGETVAQRAQNFGVEYLIIGENLAYAPDLELAHTGLMNSPGHRDNILSSKFNKIGIAVMDAGVYGLMITQVFSN